MHRPDGFVTGFVFYLGSHHASQRWFDLALPLFVSRRVLTARKRLPEARAAWALDSGGFTELSLHGEWRTTESEYVADVRRFHGRCDRRAKRCEPRTLARTR